MIVQNTDVFGIVFAGEVSDTVRSAARELVRLGYLEIETNCANIDFLNALNAWRKDNSLPIFDYVEPLTLRKLLGGEYFGDSLILLAKCAETLDSDTEKYKFCRKTLTFVKQTSSDLYIYLSGRFDISKLNAPSENSLKCAVIAYLLS